MTNKNMQRKPKQKRSRDRVQLILAATRGVLEKDGIKALSTNSIAARADIPVSSIYQYFPDKETILIAVYEDYLEKIRTTFEEVDTPENRKLPWQEFITRTLKSLAIAETRDHIDAELDIALGLYPKLMELDQRHEEWMAERLVDNFKSLGSSWTRPKLKRLAHYLYANNATYWDYRNRHNPPNKEAFEWYLTSSLAVASKCFE
tara:strand:+ start:96 stop:707 length:612 start_codon:yes stop_codon:yes gene_type:complete